eukprot:1444117-Pyramimonas_sp.AAC.1
MFSPCRRAASPCRKCIPRGARASKLAATSMTTRSSALLAEAASQVPRGRISPDCLASRPYQPLAKSTAEVGNEVEEEARLSSSQSFSLPSSSASAPFIPSFVVASPSFVPAAQCPAPCSSSLLASPGPSHLAAPPHHSSLLSSSIFFSSSFSSSFPS